MTRPTLMAHDGGWRSRVLSAWQRWEAWAISFNGHIVWFASDDVHERHRDFAIEIELPDWPWRWVCWIQGHKPYGPAGNDRYCMICNKDLQ